jgi:hypothetical protein
MQPKEEYGGCLITQKPIAPPSHFWYNKQYQKTYI